MYERSLQSIRCLADSHPHLAFHVVSLFLLHTDSCGVTLTHANTNGQYAGQSSNWAEEYFCSEFISGNQSFTPSVFSRAALESGIEYEVYKCVTMKQSNVRTVHVC